MVLIDSSILLYLNKIYDKRYLLDYRLYQITF